MGGAKRSSRGALRGRCLAVWAPRCAGRAAGPWLRTPPRPAARCAWLAHRAGTAAAGRTRGAQLADESAPRKEAAGGSRRPSTRANAPFLAETVCALSPGIATAAVRAFPGLSLPHDPVEPCPTSRPLSSRAQVSVCDLPSGAALLRIQNARKQNHLLVGGYIHLICAFPRRQHIRVVFVD